MMMRCMELGGIECYYDKEHKVTPGSNKYGSYEVPRSESTTPEAYKTKWASMFQHPNKCVKIEMMKIGNIPDKGFFQVVFMLRNPEAIRKSLLHQWGPSDDTRRLEPSDNYFRLVGKTLLLLTTQPNVFVQIFSYEEVIRNPLWTFVQLKNTGWPIDATNAAMGVEPQEKRF